MTSPNEFDDNRFAQLLDMVLSSTGMEIPSDISETERIELEHLNALFIAIDNAWQEPETDRQRIHTLFLQKLETKYPEHPWVQKDTICTLGDLVRSDRIGIPALPAKTLATLESDATPVKTLLDPAKRTAVIGSAIRQAALPQGRLSAFMRWLNQALAQLSSSPELGTQGFQFTRTQNKPRKYSTTEQE